MNSYIFYSNYIEGKKPPPYNIKERHFKVYFESNLIHISCSSFHSFFVSGTKINSSLYQLNFPHGGFFKIGPGFNSMMVEKGQHYSILSKYIGTLVPN